MKTLQSYGGGNLQELYYNNKDLALLLDLLAENSGVAPSLRILGLFDRDFRSTIEPSHVDVERLSGAGGDIEIRVKFEEAVNALRLMKDSKLIPNILYTVEAKPHTKSSGIETFSSGSENIINPRKLVVDAERNGSEMQEIEGIDYTSVIQDVDPTTAYKICISTLINGKTVARRIESLKALEVEEDDIDEK
ncbi:Leucinerich repeatcontaining protein 8Dlike (Silurana), partial [Caligus rogercresseyi]